jgi:hypothetical protein
MPRVSLFHGIYGHKAEEVNTHSVYIRHDGLLSLHFERLTPWEASSSAT